MKRFLSVLLALLMLPVAGALAQSEQPDSSLLGVVYYPRGSTEETASFAFRYRLPQFSAEQPQYEAVNQYFASYAADVVETLIPATIGALDELPASGEPEYYVDLDYRITASTGDHLSVLLNSQQFLGNTLTEQWVSVVFAQDGIYAGQPISLSQAMGLEQESGAGDVASELVYGLVWQIIRYETDAMRGAYFPDLTEEEYRLAFSPQDDFYFDEDGNFVFFIQAGTVAGEVEGVLTYPFSLAELLSGIV
ncbi:MAG: hypothetical protein JW811_07375 [Clostridiales bacterium]|nr:hypothetical protein [Clostridiales bacterium]